jgi:hypothetical protein
MKTPLGRERWLQETRKMRLDGSTHAWGAGCRLPVESGGQVGAQRRVRGSRLHRMPRCSQVKLRTLSGNIAMTATTSNPFIATPKSPLNHPLQNPLFIHYFRDSTRTGYEMYVRDKSRTSTGITHSVACGPLRAFPLLRAAPSIASSFADSVSASGRSFAVIVSRNRRRMRARLLSNASRYMY